MILPSLFVFACVLIAAQSQSVSIFIAEESGGLKSVYPEQINTNANGELELPGYSGHSGSDDLQFEVESIAGDSPERFALKDASRRAQASNDIHAYNALRGLAELSGYGNGKAADLRLNYVSTREWPEEYYEDASDIANRNQQSAPVHPVPNAPTVERFYNFVKERQPQSFSPVPYPQKMTFHQPQVLGYSFVPIYAQQQFAPIPLQAGSK